MDFADSEIFLFRFKLFNISLSNFIPHKNIYVNLLLLLNIIKSSISFRLSLILVFNFSN